MVKKELNSKLLKARPHLHANTNEAGRGEAYANICLNCTTRQNVVVRWASEWFSLKYRLQADSVRSVSDRTEGVFLSSVTRLHYYTCLASACLARVFVPMWTRPNICQTPKFCIGTSVGGKSIKNRFNQFLKLLFKINFLKTINRCVNTFSCFVFHSNISSYIIIYMYYLTFLYKFLYNIHISTISIFRAPQLHLEEGGEGRGIDIMRSQTFLYKFKSK